MADYLQPALQAILIPESCWIEIPPEFLINTPYDKVVAIVDAVYTDFDKKILYISISKQSCHIIAY